jgi:peroxidase
MPAYISSFLLELLQQPISSDRDHLHISSYLSQASEMAASALVASALLLLAVGCHASPYWPLEIGFYHDKCPQAEAVVKGVMEHAISQNPGNGAAMIRMLFHDCFVEVLTN